MVELVVGLDAPSLAEAVAADRALASAATTRHRLNLRAPASVSYLRTLASAQRSLAARIVHAIPDAQVRWRYGVVLDGMAVVVARDEAPKLARVPGVARVYPSVTYHALLDRSPQLIGAPALWGSSLQTAGNGIKIGIIDDGLDRTHPFFNPSGFTTPPGFPKGNLAYTTPKVIVARAFTPAGETWRYAGLPFDPKYSEHATHVAGIAAGDYGLVTNGVVVSGVAPNAYLGNYKALSVPTSGFGLDGNSPEIAAAIEAAVRDGMDVINLSLGEPEVAPSRDLVVEAIDAAADAGVVPVIAAGNDFLDFGGGSIGSPGTAPKAITAAAVSNGREVPADVIAEFSSAGPTPVSLELKPDVSAPGENVLSSVPRSDGLWAILSGTSMASPHVAGAAALLKDRHPSWTVAQIKSALVLTGDPAYTSTGKNREAATTREGGGLVDLPRADSPLVFADPVSLSFGLLRTGDSAVRSVSLTDAGGGAGPWTVTISQQSTDAGVTVQAPPFVTVPGQLDVTASAAVGASERDLTGFVILQRGADVRRIPYWFRVESPQIAREPFTLLRRTGTYQGNTAGKPSLVSTYRYPDDPRGSRIARVLSGPEQVFRVHLAQPVANFGVAVLSRAAGVSVEPRVVYAGDENRLVGYTGLPLSLNPYQSTFGIPNGVAGADVPTAGDYDVVFDTAAGGSPGRFTFRFWIDDSTPPSIRLLGLGPGLGLRVAVTDDGSGVDPGTVSATIDDTRRSLTLRRGVARIDLTGLSPGTHTLRVVASDRQESKNMENVPPILPNTARLVTRVRLLR